MTPTEYWSTGVGCEHLTPPRARTPEHAGFAPLIKDWTAGRSVVDFGCGRGRLAHIFEPALYTGVDICPAAIDEAREQHPDHRFEVAGRELPASDILFANSVLMHLPDDLLPETIRSFRSARVIVAEILGRHWRRPGLPPVFNRDLVEYEAAFAPRFHRTNLVTFPCAHYPGTDLTVLEFIVTQQ